MTSKRNYLVSFPASGNHLTRFFIELLTENPTKGMNDTTDIELYKNTYTENVPFNIQEGDRNYIFYKEHNKVSYKNINKLIFLVRNPREIIVKNSLYKVSKKYWNYYFDLIDFFNKFQGKKILFFYEDMITQKINFVQSLYKFLETENRDKLEYCVNNIEKLYKLSLNGKNRSWGGNNSDNKLNF